MNTKNKIFIKMNRNALETELYFKATLSSGKGGQHVNKVATCVTLNFKVEQSEFLTVEEKRVILEKLSNRISKDGILHISSQSTRSQLRNKNDVVHRFFNLLEETLKPEKVRKISKPNAVKKEERLRQKKKQAQKKQTRKKVGIPSDTDFFNSEQLPTFTVL